jgi:molybdopterin synthase sulfur carrier subunit
MPIKVRIPTQLRTLTDGAPEVEAEGATVGAVVQDLETKHPGLAERLLDEGGSLRRFINIYVNDEDVRFQEGLETQVPDPGTVSIIPAVAGGSIC